MGKIPQKTQRLKMRFGFSAAVVAVLIVFAYQNCSPAGMTGHERSKPLASQKEVMPADFVSVVEYGQQVDPGYADIAGHIGTAAIGLKLDISTGQMEKWQNIDRAGTKKSCAVSEDRVVRLRRLLSESSICEPELGPDEAVCMMYSYADIALKGSGAADGQSHTYLLRGQSCAGGQFLCGDADAQLRAQLAELSAMNCP